MGMAGALPGLKEDILSLYAAVLANFHVCAEYDLTSATPDWLAVASDDVDRAMGTLVAAIWIRVKFQSVSDSAPRYGAHRGFAQKPV
jgi:hypothetical protein